MPDFAEQSDFRRKVGEPQDSNYIGAIHFQTFSKFLHVTKRPGFKKPCPFPSASEEPYERPRFVKIDVVYLSLTCHNKSPTSADRLESDWNRYEDIAVLSFHYVHA